MEMLEIEGKHYPIQVIDEEAVTAISSFRPQNEGICHAIASLEEIYDAAATAIAEARSEANVICGLGGVSEKEIELPPNTEGDSILSSLEDLAKVFD